MKQIVAAVCDSDEVYVNRFAMYTSNHHKEHIVIHTYTKLEAFMKGLLNCRFHIVLLGDGFEEAKEGIKQYQIPVLYLTEEPEIDSHADIFHRSGEQNQRWSSINCLAEQIQYQARAEKRIFKYQSAETIMHEIYQSCEKEEVSGEYHGKKGKIEWIAVYSPVGHEMQMPFSATVASLLSEKKKVLYLNFMEWSGFLELFQLEGERNLEDLLVKIRQNRLSGEGFWQMVSQNETLYYIPPATNPENLYQMEKSEYFKLMAFLEEETDFEAVILDFGSTLQGFFDILEHCSTIFLLMKSGGIAECRKLQFENAIQKSGHDSLLKKIQMIQLPFSTLQVVPTAGLLEQFKWSEIGDIARKKLFGVVEYGD